MVRAFENRAFDPFMVRLPHTSCQVRIPLSLWNESTHFKERRRATLRYSQNSKGTKIHFRGREFFLSYECPEAFSPLLHFVVCSSRCPCNPLVPISRLLNQAIWSFDCSCKDSTVPKAVKTLTTVCAIDGQALLTRGAVVSSFTHATYLSRMLRLANAVASIARTAHVAIRSQTRRAGAARRTTRRAADLAFPKIALSGRGIAVSWAVETGRAGSVRRELAHRAGRAAWIVGTAFLEASVTLGGCWVAVRRAVKAGRALSMADKVTFGARWARWVVRAALLEVLGAL